MAKNTKPSRGRSWKNERASVDRKDSSRPRSNKYSASDKTSRKEAGSAGRYWRAGYTRKDGTKVKGHYVNKPSG